MLVRFAVCEGLAVAIWLASLILELSLRATHPGGVPDEFWVGLLRVLPIGAAVAATILPILFFAAPMRPGRRRRTYGTRVART